MMHEYDELDIPEGIPEGLWVSLTSYTADRDWLPPQGTPGLRALVKLGTSPTPRDLEWIECQQELFPRAQAVLEKIHELAPMPTTEQVMNGDEVEYPDWVGTMWAETLMHPWSQDLADAIEEAEAYVGAKASAEA